jgi:hypothetical protein
MRDQVSGIHRLDVVGQLCIPRRPRRQPARRGLGTTPTA